MKSKINKRITTNGLPKLESNWKALLCLRKKNYPFSFILFKQWSLKEIDNETPPKTITTYKLQAINIKTQKECWIEATTDELLDHKSEIALKVQLKWYDSFDENVIFGYLKKKMKEKHPDFFKKL